MKIELMEHQFINIWTIHNLKVLILQSFVLKGKLTSGREGALASNFNYDFE